jgi:hypothetical protein
MEESRILDSRTFPIHAHLKSVDNHHRTHLIAKLRLYRSSVQRCYAEI